MNGDSSIVLGAGVVGLSVARQLAARGRKVLLFDTGHPGGQGSRAAAGVAIPSVRLLDDPIMMAFTQKARAVLVEDLQSLPDAGALRRGSGILRLVADAKTQKELESRAAQHPGWLGQWVPNEKLAGLEPALEGTTLLGAFLDAEGFMVDTEAYLTAMLHDAAARGVDVHLSESVLRFEAHGPSVEVWTDRQKYVAAQLVIAGGAWSAQLVGLPPLPVRPVRGQMMTVMHPRLRLSRILSGPTYFAPWRAGEIVVGATEEDAGFAPFNTAAGVLQLTAALARVMPLLRDARLCRTWAGLRAATPSGQPLIGPVPGLARVFVATGHGGQGILSGALTGRLLADLMTEGRSDGLEPFLPERQLAKS